MPTPSFHERASAKATVIKPDITHTIATSPELGKTSCITSLKLCHNELAPRTMSVVGADKTPRRRLVTPAEPQPNPRTTMLCRPLDPEAPAFTKKRSLDPGAPIFVYRCLNPKAKTYEPPRTSTATLLGKTTAYPRDELDDLVDQAAASLKNSENWSAFFATQRHNCNDWSDVKALNHKAAHLLSYYKKTGVPVTMHTRPWTKGKIASALARGPHQSAKEHVPFLRSEYCDMIKKGHWVLLPADALSHYTDLRLSPLGVVPQHDRRPRTIVDYSYFGVNDETIALAPHEAMQFGRALPRLLRKIHEANPRFGPVYLSTVDIADGFYRIGLRPDDALRLGVLFPTRHGERQLIAVPLVLPMGWKESPPSFCAATETVADLANNAMRNEWHSTFAPHRLDTISEEPIPDEPVTPGSRKATMPCLPLPPRRQEHYAARPLKHWDIYVDDFLGATQGNKTTRRRVKRALLNSLDKVFRPLAPTDHPMRQEPASLKKFKKGNGTWSTKKRMLGWNIDTVAQTIALPPHRAARLIEILDSIPPTLRTVPTKTWHKILGELRSMSIALPGARGLFSLLQEAFRHKDLQRPRLRLTQAVHGVLQDFRWLAKDLSSRPTRIAELVPSDPKVVGACDAAGTGMGGVFFVPDVTGTGTTPHLWRSAFPQHVQDVLVSFDNPTGTVNNSELELCGNIAHHDIVAQTTDLRERTIATMSDNVASVYWLRKGSTTTTKPPAYLLRIQAHHQRFHRYIPRHDYIPGPKNSMADDCSRLWHLSDSQLLAHFNSTYPQTKPWQICHLSSQMNSALISALRRTPCDLQSIRTTPSARMPIGSSGSNFVPSATWTRSWQTFRILSPTSKSLPSDIEMEKLPPAATSSQLSTFVTSSARLVRRSPFWGPRTPG